jgi:hypothetical protein
MLGHYLRYNLHLAENLIQEGGCFPEKWEVTAVPDWVDIALADSEKLREEVKRIQDLAAEVRAMVSKLNYGLCCIVTPPSLTKILY